MTRSFSRALIFTALLLAGLGLGLQSVRIGLGQKAVRDGNGPAAAAIRPQNGWGLALLAERQLEQGQAVQAIATSRAAIERTPLAVVAVRTLARAEDKLHGSGRGEAAWQAASLLGWRDKQVQVWAAFRALTNGQAEIFAMRADALMRTGDPDELMTKFVREAVVEPRIRRAFIARLATNPPWRARFFRAETPPSGRALQGVVAVLNDLGTAPGPPSRRELRDAIMGLISERRYDQAVALDRRYVRRSRDPESLIDDGGFELQQSDYVSDATPFDWMIDSRGAGIEEAGGHRSIIVFAAGSPDPALRRFLPLAAGSYRIEYRLAGPPEDDRTLRFAARCAASAAVIGSSGESSMAVEHGDRRSFEFTVPPGCGLVSLTLVRVQQGSEDVIVDDVSVQQI
jgi:hypothetical protein